MRGLPGAIGEGVALFIDYGLPRCASTIEASGAKALLCHYRHRFHDDPLALVGIQDIGAWVDFTAVAEAASDAGFGVAGSSRDATHFLIGCGIRRYLAALADAAITDRVQLASACCSRCPA